MSAAIQLSNGEDKHPSKGDTIKYIYTNSQHKNPLCRVVPIDTTYAAETVLGYFGFDRTIYRNKKNIGARKWKWLQDLREEREKDINVETMGK